MLRSLMTAVTGVKAHQTMLDVTGHNIANVNTPGYKKDFTVFQDLLYQTSQGASGPGDNRGGINPAQVGLGVTVASIETIHTQGGKQETGNKSDMMINGDGFFVLKSGASTLFSRAGAFIRDESNNLVQSGSGYRVQGYKMERDPLNPQKFIRSSEISDINIPMGKKMEARGTTQVNFQCNLDARSNAFLPIGFEDSPYNDSPCGEWSRVKIEGVEYDLKFDTTATGKDGKGYLTVTLKNGDKDVSFTLDMKGVDESGRPRFEYKGGEIELPNSGTPSTKITPAYPKDPNDPKVDLGILKLGDLDIPMFPRMHYKYVELTRQKADKTEEKLKLLVEFDERPKTHAKDKKEVKMTVWEFDKDGNITANSKHEVNIKITQDGKFDVNPPIGLKFDTDPFNVDNAVRLQASESGNALEFRAAKSGVTPALDNTALYQEPGGSVVIGGFHQTKKTIFDCQGNPHTLEVNFKKITENRWRWEAFLVDSEGKTTSSQPCNTGESVGTAGTFGAHGELSFCRCGQYCDVETNKAEIDLPFSLDGGKNQKVTLSFGGNGDPMNGVTQFASETTTKAVYQDGYTMGVLKDYSIGKDGTITGVYTNDQKQPLYRVALATFANQQGLEKVGDAAFTATVNSGEANIDAADSNGKGTITGGALEMSNVDLTEEFTRLIISQRGFQANTRVVTTSDQILEEVVNLKR